MVCGLPRPRPRTARGPRRVPPAAVHRRATVRGRATREAAAAPPARHPRPTQQGVDPVGRGYPRASRRPPGMARAPRRAASSGPGPRARAAAAPVAGARQEQFDPRRSRPLRRRKGAHAALPQPRQHAFDVLAGAETVDPMVGAAARVERLIERADLHIVRRRRRSGRGSCRNRAGRAPAARSGRSRSGHANAAARSPRRRSTASRPPPAHDRRAAWRACGAARGSDARRSGRSGGQAVAACPTWWLSRFRVAATRCWAIPRTPRKIQKHSHATLLCRSRRTTRTFRKRHV